MAAGAVIILMPVLIALSWEAKATMTVAPDGPFAVGVRIERVELSGREAAVMVWYPADAVPGSEGYGYLDGGLEGSAVLDAAPFQADAPYPLILFSHGLGMCGCQSVFYTENLASAGYVVVAPDHKDSAICHIDAEPDVSISEIVWAFIKGRGDLGKSVMALFGDRFEEEDHNDTYRAREASAAIDRALLWNRDPSSFLYCMIDPERIGATGHSLGGFTTLMVGGVPFDCQGTTPSPEECEKEKGERRTPSSCCMESIREMDPFELRDDRVKAILPLGPVAFFPDLEQAVTRLEIPIMVISGGHRFEVPWEWAWTIYENAPPPKYAIRLAGTDHTTIADVSLTKSSIAKVLLPGFRSGFPEKAEAYKDYSVAFFDLYLKGDSSRAVILTAPPANKFVELWHEGNGARH
jgi:predicted dienelactone hydrolase